MALGRPSRTYRRLQFLIPAVIAYYKLVRPFIKEHSSKGLFKFLLAVLVIYRCVRNLPLIIGIDPPETRSGFSRDYYRATWITTAMDAGFWSCLKIKWKWLRDIASVLVTGYYLIAYETATAKCAKFRAQPTVHLLKSSWEKQNNWIFKAVIKLNLPSMGYTTIINVPRHSDEWGYDEQDVNTTQTITHLYFDGTPESFKNQRDFILFVPGGGWVATDPTSHEEYIYDLVKFSKLPLIALNYLKAPKYPFPYALEECLAFYKQFMTTNGTCIGLHPINENRRIVLLGDSAGGNIACGLVVKCIEQQFQVPHHFIMMYPCLNLDLKCWLEPDHIDLLNAKELRSVNSFLDTTTGEHRQTKSFVNLTSMSPIETKRNKSYFDLQSKVLDYQKRDEYKEPSIWTAFGNRDDIEHEINLKQLNSSAQLASVSATNMKRFDHDINHSSPATVSYLQREENRGHIALTSRICFFQDKILPAELMRALVLLYLKNSPIDPQINTNYVLSPLLAPNSILQKFPKLSILVGDRDPILDDSIIFSAKVRRAKNDQDSVQLTVIPVIYIYLGMEPWIFAV